MSERFIVFAVFGYPAAGGKETESFSVLDTMQAYEEVFGAYAGSGALEQRRARAVKVCEQLNREDRRQQSSASQGILDSELAPLRKDAANGQVPGVH